MIVMVMGFPCLFFALSWCSSKTFRPSVSPFFFFVLPSNNLQVSLSSFVAFRCLFVLFLPLFPCFACSWCCCRSLLACAAADDGDAPSDCRAHPTTHHSTQNPYSAHEGLHRVQQVLLIRTWPFLVFWSFTCGSSDTMGLSRLPHIMSEPKKRRIVLDNTLLNVPLLLSLSSIPTSSQSPTACAGCGLHSLI